MPLTRSPLLIALAATALALLLAAALVAWRWIAPPEPASHAALMHGAPWQIETPLPSQARVMGLALPGSTLAELRQRWGPDLQVALMASPRGSITLEAYLERFETGGVSGRLLLGFDIADRAEAVARWRAAAPGLPQESGARRHGLSEAAIQELGGAALVGVTYIPEAQLSADLLLARFGQPAERLAEGERLQHWLYPALGLALVLDTKGRELLQYVAPADFQARLALPLRAGTRPL